MAGRILAAVLIVALVVACIWGYKRYKTQNAEYNGAITCTGCMTAEQDARFQREDHGEDPNAWPTPSRTDSQPVTPNPGPYETTATNPNNAPGEMPPGYSNPSPEPYRTQPTPVQPATPPPSRDTIAPNPPNGMRFAGSGPYQWYREGDITWRVNTVTGDSCIMYATMEEWRKKLVMEHGCGNRV